MNVGFPVLSDEDVPGRIGRPEYYSFWRDVLKADEEILSIVRDGYFPPFVNGEIPPPSFEDNNKSALENLDFLLEQLIILERIGCIESVSSRPRIVLPCSVVYSNKWRLVIDASRAINPYIFKQSVVLDSFEMVEQASRPGDFQTKQDLTAGYYHIPLHPDARTLFGVHFRFPDGSVRFWRWKTLFLGESNAVHLFTKVLRPHRQFLANKGIRHACYIDDFKIMSDSFLKCLSDTQTHLEALSLAGWVVKPKKCINHPTRRIEFLGLIKDTVRESYFIPDRKKLRILSEIERVLNADFVPVRALAGLYGLLISVYKAVGPLVRLLTRFGFFIINGAESWNQLVWITPSCKAELSYIRDNLDDLEGYRYESREPPTFIFSRSFASDASGIGCGTVEFSSSGLKLCMQRAFTAEEMAASSTERELIALVDFYVRNLEALRGLSIIHYTDNYNLERLFMIGSRRSRLHTLLFKIFSSLVKFGIRLQVKWLPRENPVMVVADYYSRNLDRTDYSLSHSCFHAISAAWGPFSVDAFANDHNAVVSRFFSMLYSERAEGMDGLAQNWEDEHLWLFPPVSLVVPAIRKLCGSEGASGVLVCPLWRTASFFSVILPDGQHFANFVLAFLLFSPKYYSHPSVKSKMFRGVRPWDSLALYVAEGQADPFEPNFSKTHCLRNGCPRCD